MRPVKFYFWELKAFTKCLYYIQVPIHNYSNEPWKTPRSIEGAFLWTNLQVFCQTHRATFSFPNLSESFGCKCTESSSWRERDRRCRVSSVRIPWVRMRRQLVKVGSQWKQLNLQNGYVCKYYSSLSWYCLIFNKLSSANIKFTTNETLLFMESPLNFFINSGHRKVLWIFISGYLPTKMYPIKMVQVI